MGGSCARVWALKSSGFRHSLQVPPPPVPELTGVGIEGVQNLDLHFGNWIDNVDNQLSRATMGDAFTETLSVDLA